MHAFKNSGHYIVIGLLLVNIAFTAERGLLLEKIYSEDNGAYVNANAVLDQIIKTYPNRVAAIEMHIASNSPMFCAEAKSWCNYYLLPRFDNENYWFGPDGNQLSDSCGSWSSEILQKMSISTSLIIDVWGVYNTSLRRGIIYATYKNDSKEMVNDARAIFAITEDSVDHRTSDGAYWHNNVARAFLPHKNGLIVNIEPWSSITLCETFVLQNCWNADKCKFVAWLQNDARQPDACPDFYQCKTVSMNDLLMNKEKYFESNYGFKSINVFPNPCVDIVKFSFALPVGTIYKIEIYDAAGRHINTLNGRVLGKEENIKWDGRDKNGFFVYPGVYLYYFLSNSSLNTKGKFVFMH